ncbi:MAG: ABC transporter ATP-binding protein [Deltaproteobacteria bacterium]|nr:ABC transporter ATP-binding protein [Deltaproteobacteria bacterium]
MNSAATPLNDHAAVAVLHQAARSFGPRVALANVDLRVRAGELVGVIGPNGGGKSTLLFLLAGLLRPSAGTVTVAGCAAHELSRTATGRIGLVTARPGLYPLLSGRENLRHFGGLFGHAAADVDAGAEPLVRAFELHAHLDVRVGALSTGMQQKLSLVRALMLAPVLLLLDEPTANLDPLAARTLYTEVRRRADQGLACVLVTHDLAAAEGVCDRVLLVDGGIKRELAFSGRRAATAGPLLDAWRAALGAS